VRGVRSSSAALVGAKATARDNGPVVRILAARLECRFVKCSLQAV
jgi:hypothetical protein